MVSDEKLAINLIEDLLYWIICFSLAAFKIFFLSLCFASLIMMRVGVNLFKFILTGFC